MAAVNSERISGVDTFILYKEQVSYGTAVTPDTIFGGLITSASFEVDRQYNERPGFSGTNDYDGRATAQQLPGTIVTSGQVEFDVQRWDWLALVLLKDRTGAGTVADKYVYTTGKSSKTLTVTEEIDNATNSSRVYTMNINSASIRCGVGEPVTASVSLIGGKYSVGTALNTKQAQLTDEVYNFSGGSISFGATAFDNVIDSVSLDINNNFTVLYGFNEEAQNSRPGKLNINFKISAKYLNDDQIDKLIAKTLVDVTLKFEKGNDKEMSIKMENCVISRIGDTHNLNEFVVEESDVLPRIITAEEVV